MYMKLDRSFTFIARQHAYARMLSAILLWQICPSVCLSVSWLIGVKRHFLHTLALSCHTSMNYVT